MLLQGFIQDEGRLGKSSTTVFHKSPLDTPWLFLEHDLPISSSLANTNSQTADSVAHHKRERNLTNKLYPNLHIYLKLTHRWPQIRDSQHIYTITWYSIRYIHISTFRLSNSTLLLAVRHLSHLETCLTLLRKMVFRGTKHGLSQPERCLTAKAKRSFADEMGQKWASRSLVRAKLRHNFFTKLPDRRHTPTIRCASRLPMPSTCLSHPARSKH